MDSTDQDSVPFSASDFEPLTTFTLFPFFPTEVRLEIFEHALPSNSRGFRMLRVKADHVTAKPGSKNKGYLKFHLLDNIHSACIRDVSLLSTCTESRGVFLARFRHILNAGKKGLIRFADEDLVYITNFNILANRAPIFKPSYEHLLRDLTMHNLALPDQMFLPHNVCAWALPKKDSVTTPTMSGLDTQGQYIPVFTLLPNLKVLACVEWDWDNLEDVGREVYAKWVEDSRVGEPARRMREQLVNRLMVIRSGWAVMRTDGLKVPLLKSVSIDGNWGQ